MICLISKLPPTDGYVNTIMQITVQDRQTYKITQREFTDEGFLRVPGKVARTGIQQYLACELGLDGDPNRIINVYRPEEEVFNADSLASFDGVDITLQHPDTLVDSNNYSRVSKGVVRGSGTRTDDNFVQCNLLIKAKDTVDAVLSGTCELSAGYTATYDDTPGVAPDGTPYQFKQTNIRINHVAVVDRARAGSNARIFDNKTTGDRAMHQITTDTGRVLEVADAAVADAFDRLQKRVNDAEATAKSVQASLDASQAKVDDLTGKLENAVKASSDEAIKTRVEEIAQVQTKARKIAGDSFTCDSVNSVEIMRAALTSRYPSRSFADKAEAYIQAAFDMASEEDEDEEKPSKDAQYQQLALDAAKGTQPQQSAYDKFKQQVSNAHRGGN
jgi:Uncharacterized protein conserved in bacteria